MRNWLNLFRFSSSVPPRLPSIDDAGPLRGRRILLRASLNAPIKDGVVTERFRIEQAVPAIKYLQSKGARVIVIGHIGREEKETLAPVFDVLKELVGAKWGGFLDINGASKTHDLSDGDVLLFENLRHDSREADNDDSLAIELAALADIYINDAFSDSHREHSSIVGVPKHLPSYFGPSFIKEYEELYQALDPKSPSIFILGGAKFETKMPLVKKMSQKYDKVFIGGALANDIFKAKGLEIGKSLVSPVSLSGNEILKDPKILAPVDVVIDGPDGRRTVNPEEVTPADKILDAGPATIDILSPYIKSAKSILWNGPLGNFELGFSTATEKLAKLIADSQARSIIGGGDTIASIHGLQIDDKFDFVSTAGGAMLVFLETGTLPAIEAIRKR